jgi:hypothetical protein
VTGTQTKNGKDDAKKLPNAPEDGLKPPEGGKMPKGFNSNPPGYYYGHRIDKNRPGDEYRDDPKDPSDPGTPGKRQGCKYHGNDQPGWHNGLNAGDDVALDLTFVGKIIDTCNNREVIKSATWTVKGSQYLGRKNGDK